jgi:glycosyltransferase involved in cell wall biosynthesis
MKTAKPLVSVLINNFNYARFLPAAIESVLAQTYQSVQIIVVDDGSTDESLKMLEPYRGRVHVIAKSNGGQASAFNAGFTVISGDIVCLLDADDLFRPEKLERLVEVFASNPEANWAFDQLTKWQDGESVDQGIAMVARNVIERPWGLWDVRRDVATGVVPYVPTATSGLSFRRTFLSSILPMPESIRITSDNYIKFCSMASSSGLMLEESFTLQRIHGLNAYTHLKKGKTALMNKVALLTAMALYRKSPNLQRFGLSMFSTHFGRLVVTGQLDSATRAETKPFFKSLPTATMVKVLARAAYKAVQRS